MIVVGSDGSDEGAAGDRRGFRTSTEDCVFQVCERLARGPPAEFDSCRMADRVYLEESARAYTALDLINSRITAHESALAPMLAVRSDIHLEHNRPSQALQDAERADEIEAAPETGVMIYGLFIDGARWDRENGIIADQYPAKMVETMPVVWFKPLENFKPDPEDYQAPLYKTSLR